jgi:hypothetical protein
MVCGVLGCRQGPGVTIAAYGAFSPAAETAFRTAYGLLLLLQLIWTWPHAGRFFTTERYGGYIESSLVRDRAHTPLTAWAVISLWTLCATALIAGIAVLPAALAVAVLSYYFFLRLRWKTILRGMGAPGHMNYWIASFIALLALSDALPASVPLRPLTAAAFRVDFALIMIFAGIYKLTAGYARGDGFERGLVNPWWGWWSAWLVRLSPRNPMFSLLDHAAYAAEILCGISFLIPPVAPYGALLLGLSFLGIGAAIRLTFLAEMVAASCLIYVWPGTAPDRFFATVFSAPATPHFGGVAAAGLAWVLCAVPIAYVSLLPLGYAVMCANFYFRRRLWEPVQRFFDAWNGAFGLILWRVFTNDIICFFCEIFERRGDGSEHPVRERLRFNHVGEFICLASLFTTLKYYPNDPGLFRARILRYVKSLHRGVAVFRYYRIERQASFVYLPIAEFEVDAQAGTVRQRALDTRFDVSATEAGSPIHTTGRPGSYAPV